MERSYVWILLCSLLSYATSNICVPNQLVLPCACYSNSVDTYMKCSHIQKQSDLEKVFNQTSIFDFESFVLSHSRINFIPGYTLRDKSFKSIKISHSNLSDLFDETPSDYNSLETFQLSYVTLENGVKWNQFQKLQKIENFLAKNVSIPELDTEFRNNFSKKLKFLALSGTNTTTLKDDIFTNRPHLKDLRIQKAYITTLKRSMFPTSAKIETFFFDYNLLEDIPEDLFSGMPKLLRIGLGFNKLSKVTERTFGKVFHRLTALVLEGNPISCDCSIRWLTKRNTHGKYVTGTCAYPESLAGKEIIELTKEDFSHCNR